MLGRTGSPPALTRLAFRGRNALARFSIALPIVWLDDCRPAASLAESESAQAVGPRTGGRRVVCEVALPPVRLYRFEDATVESASATFTFYDQIVIERAAGLDAARCSFEGGHVRANGRRLATIERRPEVAIERGFFLSGYGYWNYYHWLIELLPKMRYWLALPPELRAWPVLVGESVLSAPSYLEALSLFCPDPDVFVMRDDIAYRVGSVLHINAPNTSPFNLRPHTRLKVSDFLLRPDTIHDLRVRAGLSDHTQPGGRRLFLARSGPRRSYNQDEVMELFGEAGFEPIFLERMSLHEQIAAVSGAELLAGPSGAAWTNLVFCAPGARALCWMDEYSRDFAAFSTLAHVVGVDLRYLLYPSAARSTADVYSAGYRLDLNRLREELGALTGD